MNSLLNTQKNTVKMASVSFNTEQTKLLDETVQKMTAYLNDEGMGLELGICTMMLVAHLHIVELPEDEAERLAMMSMGILNGLVTIDADEREYLH